MPQPKAARMPPCEIFAAVRDFQRQKCGFQPQPNFSSTDFADCTDEKQ
jgi:hypothetical protein